MKIKKSILIVDNTTEVESQVKESLQEQFKDSHICPVVLRAKDGPDAAMKSENQKFDIVLINSEVPRLMDGGFIYGLASHKHTQEAELVILTDDEVSALPEALRRAKTFKKSTQPAELIKMMVQLFNSGVAPTPKYAVDVRVINAILTATTKVLQQFGTTAKMEKAQMKSPHEPLSGEISSVVDIESTVFKGFLCLSFDKASYLEVVSAMLMEEQTELTPENQDAVGEINNIIFGNAKSEITNYGVKMTVPRVLTGLGQKVPCANGSAGMLVPFKTSKGQFTILVCAFPLN